MFCTLQDFAGHEFFEVCMPGEKTLYLIVDKHSVSVTLCKYVNYMAQFFKLAFSFLILNKLTIKICCIYNVKHS